MFCTPLEDGNPRQRNDAPTANQDNSNQKRQGPPDANQKDDDIQVQLNAPADTSSNVQGGVKGDASAIQAAPENPNDSGRSVQPNSNPPATDPQSPTSTVEKDNAATEQATTIVPMPTSTPGVDTEAEFSPLWFLLLIPVLLLVWWFVIRRRLKAPPKPRYVREPVYRSQKLAQAPASLQHPPQAATAGAGSRGSHRFRTSPVDEDPLGTTQTDIELQHAGDERSFRDSRDKAAHLLDDGNSAELELDDLSEELELEQEENATINDAVETVVAEPHHNVDWQKSTEAIPEPQLAQPATAVESTMIQGLQQEIASLTRQLSQAHEKAQRAERQLADWKENDKLPSLEQEIESLTERLKDVEREKQQLAHQLKDQTEQVQSAQLERAHHQRAEYAEADQRDQLGHLEQQVQTLTTRLKNAEQERDQLSEELSEVQQANTVSQDEITRLETLADELTDQQTAMRKELSEKDAALDRAERQVAELTSAVENDSLPEMQQEVVSLKSQLQDITRQNQEVTKQWDALQTAQSNSLAQAEIAQSEYQQLQQENADLLAKVAEREMQLKEAQHELAQLISSAGVASADSPAMGIDPAKYARIRKKAFQLHADLKKQRKQSESIFAELIETRQKLQQAQRQAQPEA